MKRVLSIFAILAALGVVLAGCHSGEANTAEQTKSPAPDPNPDAAKGN